jgi:hypothetical protein
MNPINRAVDTGEDVEPSILEEFISKINSLRNYTNSNNEAVNENTQMLRNILIKAVGVAEDYETAIPTNGSSIEKEPQHLTFRMRRALDQLSDMLDKNYALVSSQNRTISEFKQLI